MPQEGARRPKVPRLYEIVVVPHGKESKTRTYHASRLRLIAGAVAVFLACAGVTLAVLVFTPVAMYVPIPNPMLERKYGRQIVETQERLNALAQDVLLLKDYNMQLRKALGEDSTRHTVSGDYPLSVSVEGRPPAELADSTPAAAESEPPAGLEEEGPLTTSSEEPTQNFEARFPMSTPVDGYVSQGFDPPHNHYGMDFAAKQGTPVSAAAEGYVVFAGWTYEDGNMIILSHGGGYLTVYKHNQALLKTAHAFVNRGEPIALLGTSGRTSLGPHLHFEVWKDGVPRDPNEYLLRPQRIP